MYDDEDELSAAPGAPAWMVTFADLMSLLLCFFVLLLSFSTMDVIKFKAIAASLQTSLGLEAGAVIALDAAAPALREVPTETPATEPPPEPVSEPASELPPAADASAEPTPPVVDLDSAAATLAAREQAETEQLAQDLARSLQAEIVANRIELQAEGRTVTLRIRENGSFPSGAAELQPPVRQVLARIRERLASTVGSIEVAGHSDNQPIETDRYRSNWELSSARAVSVAHELMLDGAIPPQRLSVSGHADTLPVASNDTDAGRAENRRVEIVIRR